MAQKFITTRELNLIDSWNKELIQSVAPQELIYWSISYEESRVHDLYEESERKEFKTPVRINGRVRFDQVATKSGGGAADTNYILEVELHYEECVERNLVPRIGDFIEYGQIVFEITTVGHAEPVFGQISDKLAYKLTCVSSRESLFQADNVAIENIDNTHPAQQMRPRTLGDDL